MSDRRRADLSAQTLRRSRTAVALLVSMLLAITTSLTAGRVSAQTGPAEGDRAAQSAGTFEDLANCVSETGRLLVVLLVDESGSLRQTDPTNQRVPAVKTVLTSLAPLTSVSSGGETAKVDVLLSVFSDDFQPLGGWSALTPATSPALRTRVDQLAALNRGVDTDYTTALDGAREALASRAVDVGAGSRGRPCKAVLMFTDGRFDVGPRRTAAAREKYGANKPYAPDLALTNNAEAAKVRAAGIDALCRKDGVADQVRSDGIFNLAVPLTAAIEQQDQDLLAAVSTGKSGDRTCGERNATRTGAYLPSSGLNALLATFDAVATRIAGGSQLGPVRELEVCQGDLCDEGSSNFALDPSLRRAHLFFTVPSAAVNVQLEPPDGDPVVISGRKPGTSTVAGVRVESAWVSNQAGTIDLVAGSASAEARGTWKVTFFDPTKKSQGKKASLRVYVFSDLIAQLVGRPSVAVGRPVELKAEIVARGGRKVENVVQKAEVDAVITDPVTGRASEVKLGSGTAGSPTTGFAGEYTAPEGLTSSLVRVALRLNVTTTDGVAIVATSPEVKLAARKPAGYPLVDPVELSFSAVTGDGKANANLLASPSTPPVAGACVWVGVPKIQSAPPGAGTISIDVEGGGRDEGSCRPVGSSGETPIKVSFNPSSRASGTVQGYVRVFTKANGKPALPTDIPFSFEMARGIDQAKRIAVFAILLAGGLLLPLLLLLGMNLLSTRFQAVRLVRGASVPVVVKKNGEVLRAGEDGLRPLALDGRDFENLSGAGDQRRFTWAGLAFTARTSLNPFAEGYAVVAPEGGTADVAREGRRVNLALSLAGSWIFLYDQDTTAAATARTARGAAAADAVPSEVYGRLIAFVADGPVPAQASRLLTDVRARLPRTASRLSGLTRPARSKAERLTATDTKITGKGEDKGKDKGLRRSLGRRTAKPDGPDSTGGGSVGGP